MDQWPNKADGPFDSGDSGHFWPALHTAVNAVTAVLLQYFAHLGASNCASNWRHCNHWGIDQGRLICLEMNRVLSDSLAVGFAG